MEQAADPGIPDYDEHGNLPPGIHTTNFGELADRYGGAENLYKATITNNLISFLDYISGFALLAYVDGGYVTDSLHPKDADVLVLLPRDFDWNSNEGVQLLHYQAQKTVNYLDIHPYKEGDRVRVQEMTDKIAKWQISNDVAQRPKGILKLELRT